MKISPYIFIYVLFCSGLLRGQDSTFMQLEKTIKGQISPKSIVHNGNGLFFAQNMMYNHKVTIYDRNFNLVSTISDEISLQDCGVDSPTGKFQGSPVEAAPCRGGKYMWVSNYQMYGEGYENPGTDGCKISDSYDKSFLYRINTQDFTIDETVQVGSIPKYLAITSDSRYILVSNWCSGDLSIVDNHISEEIKRVPLGRYPRGIAIDHDNHFAYVAIMGSTKIAKVNLKSEDFEVTWIENVGKKPRHLCISPDDKYLYVTLNSEGKISKIDLETETTLTKIVTGKTPRSMVLQQDGKYLYAVNYNSNTFSKVRTSDMKVIQSLPTDHHPIGITYDNNTHKIWVACYSGSIKVYEQITVEKIEETANKEDIDSKDEVILTDQDIDEVSTSTPSGHFHIVVGVFSEEKNATKMLQKCKQNGYPAYIINPHQSTKKISCQNFKTIQEAKKALNDIQSTISEGAWIYKKMIQ